METNALQSWMPELSIGALFVKIGLGKVGFRSLGNLPGVRALPICGWKCVKVGPRHPWGSKNDLGKFQPDRLMRNDAQAFFAPRCRSDKATADRSRACRLSPSRPRTSKQARQSFKGSVAFHLNSLWGLKADLRKFQLDRLMCDVEQEFSHRGSRSVGRSIMQVCSPGDVHTGEVTLRMKRSLSPEVWTNQRRVKSTCQLCVVSNCGRRRTKLWFVWKYESDAFLGPAFHVDCATHRAHYRGNS